MKLLSSFFSVFDNVIIIAMANAVFVILRRLVDIKALCDILVTFILFAWFLYWQTLSRIYL